MAGRELRVALRLGGEELAVTLPAAAAKSGAQELQARAEAHFKLQPGGYSLCDSVGPLRTAAALERVLGAGCEDGLELEVRESPEWAKMREMEARIEALTATSGAAALAALERRLLAQLSPELPLAPPEMFRAREEVEGGRLPDPPLAPPEEVLQPAPEAPLPPAPLEAPALDGLALRLRLEGLESQLEGDLRSLRDDLAQRLKSLGAEFEGDLRSLRDGLGFAEESLAQFKDWSTATAASATKASRKTADFDPFCSKPKLAYGRKVLNNSAAISFAKPTTDWQLQVLNNSAAISFAKPTTDWQQNGVPLSALAAPLPPARLERLQGCKSLPLLPPVV